MRNEKGFTLMELMIVIVIIGILAAIGVPTYQGFIARSKKAVCDTNKRTLQTALDMYRIESNGVDPVDLDALSTYMGEANSLNEFQCPMWVTGDKYGIAGGKITCPKPP